MKTIIPTFAALIFPIVLIAQTGGIIKLQNPSFEQTSDGLLDHWKDCGFKGQSMPDVQPGKYGCHAKPRHGKTYIGLVTRATSTWECVTQALEKPLLKDTSYKFVISLAAAPEYLSFTINSRNDLVNFNHPTVLRVWGVNTEEEKAELLAQTPPVAHAEWKSYVIGLKPLISDMSDIFMEAYYPDPEKKTEGNLLLDHASDLYPESAWSVFEEVLAKKNSRTSIDEIEILNPSFEIEKQEDHSLPPHWEETTNLLKTPNRVHPYYPGAQSGIVPALRVLDPEKTIVHLRAAADASFASLIATEDGRQQSLSQMLDGRLKKDSTYTFRIQLAKSKHFWEAEEGSLTMTDYNNPLRLAIWGGSAENPKAELLAISKSVKTHRWQKVHFVLKPKQDYYMLTLEAEYDPAIDKTYNGHILLDDCSRIAKIKR